MSDSTAYSTAINPGAPPLRWDNVYEAFRQVNANFEILEAALGAAGITPINFNDLDSNIVPSANGVYKLGDITKQFKSVFTAEYNQASGNELNGLWAGNAQIKGIGYTVDLPANSTVNGSLIIDPDKTFFKSVEVDGVLNVVANSFNDQLNLLSGTGISMGVSSGAESITITNTGIISASAGSGIGISGTNPLIISNTGVRSITNTAVIGTRTPGVGIHTSASTGTPVLTNTGVISISSGIGITVSLDAVTGDVTVQNSAPAQPAFQQVEVDGDNSNRLVADSTAGVLKVVSGYAISLAKTVATDTLTISVNPVHDIKGSVFGDDSSLLVDGVASRLVGPVFTATLRTSESKLSLGSNAGATSQGTLAIALGDSSGNTNQGLGAISIGASSGNINQGNTAVAIGYGSGFSGQGTSAVAIGQGAGGTNQGINAVAIGNNAGASNQVGNSIAISASGSALNPAFPGLYMDPIRSTASATGPLMYNASTKEVFYNTVLEFAGSTISTNDSSGITVDVQTTFNTDVIAENDLIIKQLLTTNQIVTNGIRGYISTGAIKTLVAASTSFSDFQTRIAALNTNIAL